MRLSISWQFRGKEEKKVDHRSQPQTSSGENFGLLGNWTAHQQAGIWNVLRA